MNGVAYIAYSTLNFLIMLNVKLYTRASKKSHKNVLPIKTILILLIRTKLLESDRQQQIVNLGVIDVLQHFCAHCGPNEASDLQQ